MGGPRPLPSPRQSGDREPPGRTKGSGGTRPSLEAGGRRAGRPPPTRASAKRRLPPRLLGGLVVWIATISHGGRDPGPAGGGGVRGTAPIPSSAALGIRKGATPALHSQAAHLTVEGRCGPLADAQGGQLGIGSGPSRPRPRAVRDWGRSRSWRSRRPGRPGAGASAAALRGASRSAARGPPFSQARPGPPGSWLRPGGWRSSGRRGDGSGRGSRLRAVRSWRGPGPIGRATAVSRRRSAGSTSR